MTEHDLRKTQGVHPQLVAKLELILAGMAAAGFPMMVTDGARTQAQQVALFAQGRTAPGPIVTNADGLVKKSNHQPHIDGFGHAVDCCFIVNGQPSWDARLPWKAYGALGEAHGMTWGGNWQSLHDLPHLELP